MYKRGKYTSVFADYYDRVIALDAAPELTATVRATLRRVLQRFLELSERYEFCPLVLIQPPETDVSSTAGVTAEDMARDAKENGFSYDRRRLSHIVEDVADNVGLPTLSLFEAFDGGRFYYTEEEMPGDDHWNPAGMQVAAQLTADELRRTCKPLARASAAH